MTVDADNLDVLFVLILDRDENQSDLSNTLEAQEKSIARTFSHEMSHTSLGFSCEKHNALNACTTSASHLVGFLYKSSKRESLITAMSETFIVRTSLNLKDTNDYCY